MMTPVTLYRPVGGNELMRIIETGMAAFPPRLYWQPIFYPVLNEQYACEIAERWNMRDADGDSAGFVTAFEIPVSYFKQFEVQTVGLAHHQELWVPAEELTVWNSHILSSIRVTKSYCGKQYTMPQEIRVCLIQNGLL
ncbi:hypothetical protein [Parachryseolinea silvisoli]|jgi:hypothetical protein|uniref:hypothetical protein n=1 Tax=Parachryseolinea silvisoli TaxID=2873601 RepID=UPI002265E6EF|nr:hypothetical protein [Parachryseolinea silvisoli]MCD9016601.1 hypothetical protein [Parachryseolinea silvisoli]